MKKTIITIFILLLTVICFAEDKNYIQQKMVRISKEPVYVITGTVNSVVISDSKKGTGGLEVWGNNGEIIGFAVEPNNVITDKDGNTLNIVNIKKGSKVLVTYTTDTYGAKVTQSIKIVE